MNPTPVRRPNSPYRSLTDLIEAARAKPEEITMAGAGIGSALHLALMQLENASGARFTWLPTTAPVRRCNWSRAGMLVLFGPSTRQARIGRAACGCWR
jgi:hypothetical protein